MGIPARVSFPSSLDPATCLAAFDSADNAALITDSSGIILWVNPAFVRMTGYSPSEVLGKTPSLLRSGCHDRFFYESLWATLLAGRVWRGELINRRKDGSHYFVEQCISPVAVTGGVTLFIAIQHDISKSKELEQELRRSERFSHAVLDAAPGHIAVIDAAGWIVMVNQAWEKFARENGDPTLASTGVGQNYLTVCTIAAASEPADDSAAVVAAGIASILEGKAPLFRMEYPCDSPTQQRWFYMQVVPLAAAGSGAVLAHMDITELKRTEDQLRKAQRLESLGRLAGGIAHDFNNVLTVINGYSHWIEEKLDARSPLREDVRRIQAAGAQAAGLTRQLLTFSRHQVLQVSPTDLSAIARESADLLRSVLGAAIDLQTDLQTAPGRVMADPSQMQQVLINLVINARDAMPGGGSILVETKNREIETPLEAYGGQIAPGSYVVLRVSDTGTGMAAATGERIFEPFFTTKAAGMGTGLGLATVFGIVKQAGGQIQLETEVGKGSTFSVYLPRTSAPAAVERKSRSVVRELRRFW